MSVRQVRNLIMMLGFPYGAILVFSAFGPVLSRIVGLQDAAFMSTVFLITLAASMIVPPGWPFAVERKRLYLPIITSVAALLVASFHLQPRPVQWVTLAVMALVLGRVAVFWSRNFLGTVPRHLRGRTIAHVLMASYGFLYLFNVVSPSLPVAVLSPAVAVLLFMTIPCFHRLPRDKTFLLSWSVQPDRPVPLYRRVPVGALTVVFLIYIVAGFTFAAMFPEFARNPADRYYNVLSYVLFVPLAGYVSDRFGRLMTMYIGVAATGLALVFFQLNPGVPQYVLSQTAVEIGWAFLGVYVWVWSADLVFLYKNAQLQNVGVATFLLGTAAGSALTIVFWEALVAERQFFLLLIPLFAAIALMGRVVRERAISPPDEEGGEDSALPVSLRAILTEREAEIATLLNGGQKNREICDVLHVSANTLKTHCRHIYRKLDVQNRVELRELVRLTRAEATLDARPIGVG